MKQCFPDFDRCTVHHHHTGPKIVQHSTALCEVSAIVERLENIPYVSAIDLGPILRIWGTYPARVECRRVGRKRAEIVVAGSTGAQTLEVVATDLDCVGRIVVKTFPRLCSRHRETSSTP